MDDALLKSVKPQQELGRSTVSPVKVQVEQIAARRPGQNNTFSFKIKLWLVVFVLIHDDKLLPL